MKKALLLIGLISQIIIAQVGINTTNPDASAVLDIVSTNAGILVPRMTEAQRTAIASPATGLLVYQTNNTTGFWFYDGSVWASLNTVSAGVEKIDDLTDGKSDSDGTQDGSSVFLGIDAGLYDDSSNNQNVGVGYKSLYSNTTGNNNMAIGYQSLYSNTTGDYNTASGYQSLYSNTTGDYNTAIGYLSLYDNTTGFFNSAIGTFSLYTNTTGHRNTAYGHSSLAYNTTGDTNTAIGYSTLIYNTTGSRNTAIGSYALYDNTTGYGNTAIGHDVLDNNTTGNRNTVSGVESLYANTTGFLNTASGYQALFANSTGNNNTAIGHQSLFNNSTGNNNIAIGNQAQYYNSTGINNTAIGYTAFSTGNTFSNSTALGYDAEPGASNTIRLGNASVSTIGGYSNWSNVSDGRFKNNVKENVIGLDFILKLRPVSYNLDLDAIAQFNKTPDSLRLKDAERLKAIEIQSGFIAQEVEKAAELVGYDFHGVDKPKNPKSHYGLRYAEFVVPLVKAVQEQQEIIESQKEQITLLEARLDRMEALIKDEQ